MLHLHMSKRRSMPIELVISSLQLLALREILRSPSFTAKDEGELQWLIELMDKTLKIDDIAREVWGGIENNPIMRTKI